MLILISKVYVIGNQGETFFDESKKIVTKRIYKKYKQVVHILVVVVSVILMICVTKVAKTTLDKALAENMEVEGNIGSPQPHILSNAPLDLHQPLILKIDSS